MTPCSAEIGLLGKDWVGHLGSLLLPDLLSLGAVNGIGSFNNDNETVPKDLQDPEMNDLLEM